MVNTLNIDFSRKLKELVADPTHPTHPLTSLAF